MIATAEPSLPVVLAKVAQLLSTALEADGCLVYQVEQGGELVLGASHPAHPEVGQQLRLPGGFGVAGRVAADGVAAVLVDDSPRNPLHRELLGLRDGQLVSRMCVPARPTGGPAVAVLAVHNYASRLFTDSEVATAQMVADLVGLRVQLERLSLAVAEYPRLWEGLVAATVSAQEAERRRVAGDLHDGVTQVIASLAFHLSAADVAFADHDFSYAVEQLRAARDLADLAFTETRNAISGLHSPVLDDLGLAAGLVSMARAVPSVHVDVDAQDIDLPEHVSTALFRIFQEAVQNVVKHAGATKAQVRLTRRGGSVVLEITDDGSGFAAPGRLTSMPRSRTSAPKYGVAGMFERVQLLGGQLSITSQPGQGTTVEVVVPDLLDGPNSSA